MATKIQQILEATPRDSVLFGSWLIFCLLGSDRPIHESFAPSLIDQREAMENQFAGMTDIPFTYEEFEETRANLINDVKLLMTEADKKFLISFESGQPEWEGYEFEYFKDYPSVQWKLLNLKKLAKQNPQKLREEVEKLGAPDKPCGENVRMLPQKLSLNDTRLKKS